MLVLKHSDWLFNLVTNQSGLNPVYWKFSLLDRVLWRKNKEKKTSFSIRDRINTNQVRQKHGRLQQQLGHEKAFVNVANLVADRQTQGWISIYAKTHSSLSTYSLIPSLRKRNQKDDSNILA